LGGGRQGGPWARGAGGGVRVAIVGRLPGCVSRALSLESGMISRRVWRRDALLYMMLYTIQQANRRAGRASRLERGAVFKKWEVPCAQD